MKAVSEKDNKREEIYQCYNSKTFPRVKEYDFCVKRATVCLAQ